MIFETTNPQMHLTRSDLTCRSKRVQSDLAAFLSGLVLIKWNNFRKTQGSEEHNPSSYSKYMEKFIPGLKDALNPNISAKNS